MLRLDTTPVVPPSGDGFSKSIHHRVGELVHKPENRVQQTLVGGLVWEYVHLGYNVLAICC
jgi:hypothetical protein